MSYNQEHDAIAKQLSDAKSKIANDTTNEDELAKVAHGALHALYNILFEADYEGFITSDNVAYNIDNDVIAAIKNL